MNTQQDNGLSKSPSPGGIGRFGRDAQLASSEDKLLQLHTIYLEHEVTDAGFQLMAKLRLPHLRELHIIDAPISDEGIVSIEELIGLRWLNIDRVKISNVSLVCIRNLENLVGLHLTNTRITDKGLWKLVRLKAPH